ncbi:hypothetical protein ACLOJK_019736 [Asimina triloba]
MVGHDAVNKLVVLRHVPSVNDNAVAALTAMSLSLSSSMNPPWTDLNEPIQFVYHDRSVEPIPDPSRPKPTLITSATQGKLFSSVVDKPTSIPLRGFDLIIDHHTFSSRAHLADDSPHDVCFFIVTDKCLDQMIQATHLIGNASLCRPSLTTACPDACTACPDAYTTRCRRLPIVLPACIARCHCTAATILSHSITINDHDRPIRRQQQRWLVGVGVTRSQ